MRPRKEPPFTRQAPGHREDARSASDEGEIITWAEVNRTHRIRNGVYQRGGRLISLLTDFGRINPCYPDQWDATGDKIYYTGDGRRGDQYLNPGNRALLSAIESGHAVPLFNKLSTGRWQHMGQWRVTAGRQLYNEEEQRMLWLFTLERADSNRDRQDEQDKENAMKHSCHECF